MVATPWAFVTLVVDASVPPPVATETPPPPEPDPNAAAVLAQCDLIRGRSYESDEERELAEEALAGCPVEAIGRDGE